MIEHVYRRCAMSAAAGEVYVATCDEEIKQAVDKFGGRAIMTSPSHQRASDRTAEAAESLDADLVVMVQGDEPLLRPEMVGLAVAPFREDDAVVCVNLTSRIAHEDEFRDRNTIKVVIDHRGHALYFSREPIPTLVNRPFALVHAFKQVCVIPFRRDALAKFIALPPTPLEMAESIDMLRFLEHGVPVRMVESPYDTHSVDTTDDLAEVERRMANDDLFRLYAS